MSNIKSAEKIALLTFEYDISLGIHPTGKEFHHLTNEWQKYYINYGKVLINLELETYPEWLTKKLKQEENQDE